MQPARYLLLLAPLWLWPALVIADEARWEQYIRAAQAAYHHGDYEEAVGQTKAALKEAKYFGAQDPRFATSLNNLAWLYHSYGRYAKAETLYERSPHPLPHRATKPPTRAHAQTRARATTVTACYTIASTTPIPRTDAIAIPPSPPATDPLGRTPPFAAPRSVKLAQSCRPARLNTHLLDHAAANNPNRLLVRTRRHNSPHFVYFGTPFIRTIRSSPRSVSSPLAPPHERNGPRHPRAENVEELALDRGKGVTITAATRP